MRLVWGIVVEADDLDDKTQRLSVATDDRRTGQAIAYTGLCGRCEISDRVLLNTTGVDLGLGTGGLFFVVARAGEGSGVALDALSGGHIMKLRYSPMQFDVRSVEEQSSPHHEVMRRAESLGGMPVACCGLHSQAVLVAAAVKQIDSTIRVAYVMTDEAALPLALSEIMRGAVSAGLIDTTVTCGHAFGGEYEAVTLHSGLLAARHVARADVAIVAIGPGVVGTATPFGHGGIAQGEAINAVKALDGIPVAVLRASFADARPRHRGVSHHTLTALSRIAVEGAVVALPDLPEEYCEEIEGALDDAGVWERHTRARLTPVTDGPPPLRGVTVRTMGRGPESDPVFFECAYAAGNACVRIAHGESA